MGDIAEELEDDVQVVNCVPECRIKLIFHEKFFENGSLIQLINFSFRFQCRISEQTCDTAGENCFSGHCEQWLSTGSLGRGAG